LLRHYQRAIERQESLVYLQHGLAQRIIVSDPIGR
jgi:hypothetical protein